MSEDRNMRRVREAYRDIATEAAPAQLDDAILAMARQESRTRYGLARAWIRPVAWAATIGLSFAFILEMTYFADELAPRDAALNESIESDGPIDQRMDGDAGEKAEPMSQAPAFKRAPATVVAAPEIQASELPALREAEESGDTAADRHSEDIAAAESRRERASLDFAARADHCDAEARQDADTWYHCVLALREQGREDAAAIELGALRETFPDFRVPEAE